MEKSQTADNALGVLFLLEDRGAMNVADIAVALGVGRTVAKRVVDTLHARGFVTRDLEDNYVLGPALLVLAAHVPNDLAIASEPLLRAFAREIHETVVVAVRDGDETVIVASESGNSSPLRVEYEVGFRQPLWQGASSLAILAFLDPAEDDVKRVCDLSPLDLKTIQKDGYARSEGHIRKDMVGLAVPIFGRNNFAVGSLAVVVPTLRVHHLTDRVSEMQEVVARIRSQYLKLVDVAETGS